MVRHHPTAWGQMWEKLEGKMEPAQSPWSWDTLFFLCINVRAQDSPALELGTCSSAPRYSARWPQTEHHTPTFPSPEVSGLTLRHATHTLALQPADSLG